MKYEEVSLPERLVIFPRRLRLSEKYPVQVSELILQGNT
jgi:hypothetical protein